MKKLASSIGFSEHVLVSAKGKAGGICLLWSNSLDAEILEFDSQTVAVKVSDDFCSWVMIGFYGLLYQTKRYKAWGNLYALLQSISEPWLCFGDFNVVVDDAEKDGGIRGSSSTPNFLKDLLFDLGAVDLGFAGCKFTQWNKCWGKGAIRERLDQAISSPDWRLKFPNANVLHLGTINSDHAPLLIDTNPTEESAPRPFWFEAMWSRDPKCGAVIKQAWNSEVYGSHAFILCRKQFHTTIALKKWNKDVFGHCQTKIKELNYRIEKLQLHDMAEQNAKHEAVLQGELNEWLKRNEILWRQKSRETWLKDGDKNSKFFCLSTVIRCKRNSIDAIKNGDGEWITCKKDIRIHVVESFQHLFREEAVEFPLDLQHLIRPSILEAKNSTLCKIPTPQEIKEVIFGMSNLKAPRPDGLSALFTKGIGILQDPLSQMQFKAFSALADSLKR